MLREKIRKWLGIEDAQPEPVVVEEPIERRHIYRAGKRTEPCVTAANIRPLDGVRAFLDRADHAPPPPRHTPKTRNRQPLVVDPEDDAALFATLRVWP